MELTILCLLAWLLIDEFSFNKHCSLHSGNWIVSHSIHSFIFKYLLRSHAVLVLGRAQEVPRLIWKDVWRQVWGQEPGRASQRRCFLNGILKDKQPRSLGLEISGNRNNLQKKMKLLGLGEGSGRTEWAAVRTSVWVVSSHTDWWPLVESLWWQPFGWTALLVLKQKLPFATCFNCQAELAPEKLSPQQTPFGSWPTVVLSSIPTIANEKVTALELKVTPNICFLGYSFCHML